MVDPAELVIRTAFPGRVRQFTAAQPGHALALAVGAAWSEQRRGGHVLAVVPPEARRDGLVEEALALAGRLQLPNLDLLPSPDPTVACEALRPRERQPVRLSSLGRDLVPRWSAETLAGALTDCAAREPLLLLPGRDPRWGLGRATLLALAWIAGDGRRVAWELPAGAPLAAWAEELALIGRLQLPLKLLADPADLPWPPAERGLERWWLAMPGPTDAAAVLAWALAGEETALMAADERCLPGGIAWLPGSAHRLADGEAGTVLCTASRPCASPPPGHGVLQLTGLWPLPLGQLARTAAPLSTADEDLARHLAGLPPHLRCTLAPSPASPHSSR